MEHHVKEEPDATVVSFTGEIDLQTSPDARQVLLDAVARGRRVFVDLSKVTYTDSSGIASLVEAFQKARERDCAFALVAVTEPVFRVLSLARLETVFTILETVEAGQAQDL